MMQLDTAIFLITQDNPAGPIVQFIDDGVEPIMPIEGEAATASKASAAANLIAYGLMAAFIGCLFFAI